jgi:integrase
VKTCGEIIEILKIHAMVSRKFTPRHLELRYRTYFAVLYVPKDVQHIIGKLKFYETTGTGDVRIAQSIASLKVIKWKAEIASARTTTDDPIIKSAIELNRMLRTSPNQLVKEVISEETYRIATNRPLVANVFNELAIGKSKHLVDFIDGWIKNEIKRGLAKKTISQMKSDVEILIEYLPTSSLLVHEHTSLWIKMVAQKGNLTASSVTRIIGSCRNFYKHLKFIDVIPEKATEPFEVPKEYKLSKKRNSKGQNKTESWLPFSNEDVERIYFETLSNKDWELGQLIVIAAFTGARIEEICSLEQCNIDLNKNYIKIVDSKTEAGVRTIPIHDELRPIIVEMLKTPSTHLLPHLTKSKFDDRSNAIGKRFGRLKNKMGFSKRFVFHSIRKTFTTQLENAGISENITADIVGHEKPRMTYGLYSGGTNLEVKRKAINKIQFSFFKKETPD